MKSFIITNLEKESIFKIGAKHQEVMNQFGDFDAEIYEAVRGKEAYTIFNNFGIKFLDDKYQNPTFRERNLRQQYDKREGIAGCFASHFLLWRKCVELNTVIGVFEYDAKQKCKMPKEFDFENLLYLSAWRNFRDNPDNYHEDMTEQGIFDYVGYDRWGFKNVMSGTHAYILKPEAAQILIETTLNKGWFPVDRFLSTDIVGFRKQTINPAIFIVEDSKNLSFDYQRGINNV